MNDDGKVATVGGEKDIFLTINGMKIAKRENRQWISLVPGYKVRDYGIMDGISVEVDRSP
jgi:predicted peroxiredoxin